tara:strand:- start:3683 stop:4831 length:1149 start_codon:yes stop_codon:yes gene_type:complete
MKLDKSQWEPVKFGEVVSNNTKALKDPLKNGVKYALGLDNFEPQNLTPISKIDIEKEGTKFSRYFEEGQLLFGSRRSYLRQMVVAPFCGVCTANIMVFDTKDKEKISRDFISLIFQSNRFIDFASGTSVGSLFPNAKWNSLKNFKFKLPDPDTQISIFQVFTSIQYQIDKSIEQHRKIKDTKDELFRDLFTNNKPFNKITYDKFSFGNLASNQSKRINPSETDLKVYVGLEHLDPNSLIINRTGVPSDVKGTKLLIFKGDIIFGKRRAYQRKIAVSHFDGICSAHSMVLRSKDENVKKEFLPYFMQSDEFMNRAVQISEGSLSPTIKWKVLEKQEFTLPKMKFQEELVETFIQFDKLMIDLKKQVEALKKLKQKLLDEILKI